MSQGPAGGANSAMSEKHEGEEGPQTRGETQNVSTAQVGSQQQGKAPSFLMTGAKIEGSLPLSKRGTVKLPDMMARRSTLKPAAEKFTQKAIDLPKGIHVQFLCTRLQ